MLSEIPDTKQFPNERRRRWFSNTYFDLIIWYEDDNSIYGFQLCYDKGNNERALSWKKGKGFLHETIDDGEIPGEIKKSPILVPDGSFDKDIILQRFLESSEKINNEITKFISEKLNDYSK